MACCLAQINQHNIHWLKQWITEPIDEEIRMSCVSNEWERERKNGTWEKMSLSLAPMMNQVTLLPRSWLSYTKTHCHLWSIYIIWPNESNGISYISFCWLKSMNTKLWRRRHLSPTHNYCFGLCVDQYKPWISAFIKYYTVVVCGWVQAMWFIATRARERASRIDRHYQTKLGLACVE